MIAEEGRMGVLVTVSCALPLIASFSCVSWCTQPALGLICSSCSFGLGPICAATFSAPAMSRYFVGLLFFFCVSVILRVCSANVFYFRWVSRVAYLVD